jgi:hypothetical protein
MSTVPGEHTAGGFVMVTVGAELIVTACDVVAEQLLAYDVPPVAVSDTETQPAGVPVMPAVGRE